MIAFEVNGQKYQASKLSAMAQLHVSRKLSPLIPQILPAAVKVKESGMDDLAALATMFTPFTTAVSAMPEADCEYLFATTLGVVQRWQNGAWTPVWNVANNTLMFDIELMEMFTIAGKVVQDSLGSFITGLLASLPSTSPVLTA
jgi:hypothetical protein